MRMVGRVVIVTVTDLGAVEVTIVMSMNVIVGMLHRLGRRSGGDPGQPERLMVCRF